MTWQSFFDLSTMGHRHIIAVYAGIWLLQGSYLAWIITQFRATKKKP